MNTLDKKTAIQFEQLRQLYSENIIPLVNSAILALILAVMQRDVISSTVLVSWFSSIILIMVSRTILTLSYQRSSSRSKNRIYLWLLRFRLGILISAVVWGAAGFLLFPANEPQHQMFLLFTLAGLTAGAVTSYAADVVSALIFSVVVLTPIIIRLFLVGESLYLAMSLASTLYLGYLVINFRHNNRNISDNILLRLEAIDREATVKTSEEHYRLLLSYSPVGIFHYDTNFIITYSNTHFAEILNSSVESVIGLNIKAIKHQAVMPILSNALEGEIGIYEGHYIASFSTADVWISMTCAPFKNSKGVIVGGIGIVQDISERKIAEEKIKNLAFYDPLTGLPNRRFLQARLNQALATSANTERRGALLFLDLDHFKLLNDSRGHDIGDLLLKQVAERLSACLGENDFVARLGGDEFLVLIENLSEHPFEACAQTELVARNILISLNQLYFLDQYEYRNDSSIGIVIFNGHDHSQDELIKQADIAMYQAKKIGRNNLCFFNPLMQEAITARIEFEHDLRKAVENWQFYLYYQIQMNSSHHPIGAEVLIRWCHPQRGFVPPAEFIPLAEETGMIVPIGLWVLDSACAQLKLWQQEPLTRNITLSVNVSTKQFFQDDFVTQIQTIILNYGIKSSLLKLELTESVLVKSIEETIVIMDALIAIGIKFSLDDFGTGYSSLQYLKRLPLYQLKIDQSFIRDLAVDSDDQTIVRTIIAMADKLHLNVIAEGVETEEQRQFLQDNGCVNYQGYLFGKPLVLDDFEALLKQSLAPTDDSFSVITTADFSIDR